MPTLTLLGPQRLQPIVAKALGRLPAIREAQADRAVAVVTAGWQEREAQVDELRDHVHRPVLNLRLYERAEAVLRDGALFQAHRQRQDRLIELRQLYQIRLRHAMKAARELMAREGEDFVEAELREAVAAVRRLDEFHLRRIAETHDEFEHSWGDAVREATHADRVELTEILSESVALCVAGGHVAVLLNRLRLFGVEALLRGQFPQLPVVAWSAGAMAMTSRVVLFHDRPPQGFGNAEVFEHGLGLAPRVVALPHASDRLRLRDRVRVGLLARRLAPARCVGLDAGHWLTWNGKRWRAGVGTERLSKNGALQQAFAR